jgi:hypothetical protein
MLLGGTVAEVKQRLTYQEAMHWHEYRRKHGGIGESRTAYLLACIATILSNANGGKAKLQDFLPGLNKGIDDAEQLYEALGLGSLE